MVSKFKVMMLFLLLVSAGLLAHPLPVSADGPIYVDADAPSPTHDGATWGTAYLTLQDALAVAASGDEIWVAEGVYYPDEGAGQTDNDRTATFSLISGVALYGGFDPQSGIDAWSERDGAAYATLLSGDIDGDDANADGNDIAETWADIVDSNAYHVLYLDGTTTPITETTVIDGFIITAGQADDWPGNGGGLYCAGNGNGSECSPTLTHVTFSGNYASSSGGGIFNNGSDQGKSNPTLTDVTFVGNYADSGGGMTNYDYYVSQGESSPTLTHVTFEGNDAGYGGGGMNNASHYGSPSHITLTDVTFTENTAENDGGGMYSNDVTLTLNDVLFTGNTAGDEGGGMYNMWVTATLTNTLFSGNLAQNGGGMYSNADRNLTLTNVTFGGNYATIRGGAMTNENSSPTLVNCILWGNSAGGQPQIYNYGDGSLPTLTYSVVEGGCPDKATCGTGVVFTDPQFAAPVSASSAPTTTGNYRLRRTSPAMNTGNNSAIAAATDLDGLPRIKDGVVDMGAYETAFFLIKQASPTMPAPYYDTITYTLVLRNDTPLDETGVILTDTLPDEVAFVTWIENPGATIANDEITWTGDVPTTSAITFTFAVTHANAPSTAFTNTAELDGRLAYVTPLVTNIPHLLHVSTSGSDGNDGSEWWSAFRTLQKALDFTDAHGDTFYEIWVAGGVYYPDEGTGHTNNNQNESFTINRNNVRLYGGFAATETLRTERDWVANPTILSGDIDQNDTNTDGNNIAETWADLQGSNAYSVLHLGAEQNYVITGDIVLDGFTITAGNHWSDGGGLYCQADTSGSVCSPSLTHLVFSGNRASYGGGLYNGAADGGISSPTLTHVTFAGNYASNGGGGVYNNDDYDGYGTSSPTLIDVIFTGNHASSGGGMYNDATYGVSSPTLINVIFTGNYASSGGGGLFNRAYSGTSSPTLIDVTFSGNQANRGGGIYTYVDGGTSRATLTRVIFTGNTADADGGGMYNCTVSGLASTHRPTLTDVTFHNNSATSYNGGGMYNDYKIFPTLTNITFSDNTAGGNGGGMYNKDDSDATLTNVTFTGNSADYGGGMYNHNVSEPTLTGGTFSDNSADYGGGMYNYDSDANLTHVTFSGNAATQSGGGMYNYDSDATLTNAIFSNNQANNGGGMYNYGSESNGMLRNVTLSGNAANTSGGGLSFIYHSGGTMVNSIVWGNAAPTGPQIYNDLVQGTSFDVTYSDLEGDCPSGVACGTGVIATDPQFVAPIAASHAPTTTGNYRLRSDSPLVDAGNDGAVTVGTDLDGHPRIMGATVDMGAYEVEQNTLAVSGAETWLDFSPEVCARVWFTNTGTLPTSIAITLTHEYPSINLNGLPRRYEIVPTGGSNYEARLELCYEDDELSQARIATSEEPNLHAYRYIGAPMWEEYSTVDMVDNTVTAHGVTEFGIWGLGIEANQPTRVSIRDVQAASSSALPGVMALGVVAWLARQRRKR